MVNDKTRFAYYNNNDILNKNYEKNVASQNHIKSYNIKCTELNY